MAIALARNGGISFIYCSQPIEKEAEMVRKVKKYKAGFVISDSNLTPDHTLRDVLELKARTGHSTMAITEDLSLIHISFSSVESVHLRQQLVQGLLPLVIACKSS